MAIAFRKGTFAQCLTSSNIGADDLSLCTDTGHILVGQTYVGCLPNEVHIWSSADYQEYCMGIHELNGATFVLHCDIRVQMETPLQDTTIKLNGHTLRGWSGSNCTIQGPGLFCIDIDTAPLLYSVVIEDCAVDISYADDGTCGTVTFNRCVVNATCNHDTDTGAASLVTALWNYNDCRLNLYPSSYDTLCFAVASLQRCLVFPGDATSGLWLIIVDDFTTASATTWFHSNITVN